jgi:hypothetical protein
MASAEAEPKRELARPFGAEVPMKMPEPAETRAGMRLLQVGPVSPQPQAKLQERGMEAGTCPVVLLGLASTTSQESQAAGAKVRVLHRRPPGASSLDAIAASRELSLSPAGQKGSRERTVSASEARLAPATQVLTVMDLGRAEPEAAPGRAPPLLRRTSMSCRLLEEP